MQVLLTILWVFTDKVYINNQSLLKRVRRIIDEESCLGKALLLDILDILLFIDALIGPLNSSFLYISLSEAKFV